MSYNDDVRIIIKNTLFNKLIWFLYSIFILQILFHIIIIYWIIFDPQSVGGYSITLLFTIPMVIIIPFLILKIPRNVKIDSLLMRMDFVFYTKQLKVDNIKSITYEKSLLPMAHKIIVKKRIGFFEILEYNVCIEDPHELENQMENLDVKFEILD